MNCVFTMVKAVLKIATTNDNNLILEPQQEFRTNQKPDL